MKYLLLLAPALLPLASVLSGSAGRPAGAAADVAVAPLTVEGDSAEALRTVADECLERLVAGLTARGITVVRQSKLSEKSLHEARPAPWAVLGHLKREHGQFQAELRLLEVESGDEMRSYFNTDTAPAGIAEFGSAAAVRIAAFIKERKGT